MTYVDFQKECAFNGFAATPLTEAEYDQALVATGGNAGSVYDLACDVAGGCDFVQTLDEYYTE